VSRRRAEHDRPLRRPAGLDRRRRVLYLFVEGKVNALTDTRARAAEMEHALKLHISQHLDEDPIRYRRLSERLDEVLAALSDQDELLVIELVTLIEEARTPREDDGLGLHPELERPLLDILVDAQVKRAEGATAPVDPASLAPLIRQFAAEVRLRAGMVGFASNPVVQDQLRKWLFNQLLDTDACDLDQAQAVADELMQVVRARVQQYARCGSDVDAW